MPREIRVGAVGLVAIASGFLVGNLYNDDLHRQITSLDSGNQSALETVIPIEFTGTIQSVDSDTLTAVIKARDLYPTNEPILVRLSIAPPATITLMQPQYTDSATLRSFYSTQDITVDELRAGQAVRVLVLRTPGDFQTSRFIVYIAPRV